MKLSLVIPVYNVEKYVADCIESCLENIACELKDVELIIVDDGSKDLSINIVQKLVKDIPYVKIVTQQNLGLSMARNRGLKEAKGEFIWFIDSDDFIAKGIVDRILLVIKEFENIDILEIQYEKVDEFVERQNFLGNDNEENVVEIITGRERFLRGFNTPAQFHIFKRDFLLDNNLSFFPGIYHEDSEFTPRALWKAKDVVVLPSVAYYYRQRKNSIMTTINPKKGRDYIFVSQRLNDFFYSQSLTTTEQGIVNDYISMTYCNGLHNAVGANEEQKKIINEAVKEYKNVLKSLIQANKRKYKILGWLALIWPRQILNFYLVAIKFKNCINKY